MTVLNLPLVKKYLANTEMVVFIFRFVIPREYAVFL